MNLKRTGKLGNPALPGLDLNWGRAAFSAGAFAQAIAPLNHYLQANPTDAAARSALGQSHVALARLELSQGNTQAAITHFEAALRLDPGNVDLQQELARIATQH